MLKLISFPRVAVSLAVALCVYGVVAFVAPATTQAQTQPTQRRDPPRVIASPTPSPSPAATTTATTATANHDLSITANVTARELLFEVVPNPTVEFPGQPRRDTVWEAERTNLPAQVQPGVTYRDIGIRLTITSVFADIERIVAEALGEIPVSDGNTAQALDPNASGASPPQTNNAPQATIAAAQSDAVSPAPVSTKTSRASSARTTPARSRSKSVSPRQRRP